MNDDSKKLLEAFRKHTGPAASKKDRLFESLSTKVRQGYVPTTDAPSATRIPALRLILSIGTMIVVGAIALLALKHTKEDRNNQAKKADMRTKSSVAHPSTTLAKPSETAHAASGAKPPQGCQAIAGPYVDATALHAVPFAQRTAWAHPWRGWLETRPAAIFRNGIGVSLNLDLQQGDDADSMTRELAKAGVRVMAMELAWNHLQADERTFLPDGFRQTAERFLRAAKRHGIRPLVRLIGHEMIPAPVVQKSRRRVTAVARKGERVLLLDDTSGIVPGRTLILLDRFGAADTLAIAIDKNQVFLSRPVPREIGVATEVSVTTLKFAPFGPAGVPEHDETILGWLRYVDATVDFLKNTLGPASAGDQGFDLEIWNSVTYGSRFLSVAQYFDPVPASFSGHSRDAAARTLLEQTAAHLAAHLRFEGIRLGNGFAGANPEWGCGLQPGRRGPISKRTPGALSAPSYTPREDTALNAQFEVDTWRPPGRLIFPEFQATFLSPEAFFRDLSPIATSVDGILHGPSGDERDACPIWVIGNGIDPEAMAPELTRDQALRIKAKIFARQYAFFLNKGATLVSVAAPMREGAEGGTGLASPRLRRGERLGDGPMDFPLNVLSRMVRRFSRTPNADRPTEDTVTFSRTGLNLFGVWDCHGHAQFPGDGTPGHPAIFNRELFAFLPFSVDPKRIVVPYYVMTWDATADLPPEHYGITVGGVPMGAAVYAYDPMTDKSVAVTERGRSSEQRELDVEATDSPRLLIFELP